MNHIATKTLFLAVVLVVDEGCVDRIHVNAESDSSRILVVDGHISDQPGPYTIKLSYSTTVDNVLQQAAPAIARKVVISDNLGHQETLSTTETGIYQTSEGGIKGEVGRSYSLTIELLDGTLFSSEPDQLLPNGTLDTLYYEWESVIPVDGPPRQGFRIFADGQAPEDIFVRWRFSGIYMANSFPELNKYEPNCSKTETGDPPPTPDPLPCSGYITTGIRTRFGLTIGDLIQVGSCTCCVCWVTDAEDKPMLNNSVISTQGKYNRIEVGYAPFTEWTFGNKRYMIRVEQMSLSKEAFEFWKIIADQKNGSTSLFQPAIGKPTTNLISENSQRKTVGYFYATSVSKKVIFLTPKDAPVAVPDPAIKPAENCALWRGCTTIFPFSSFIEPAEWID